jgi:hypothetical protein
MARLRQKDDDRMPRLLTLWRHADEQKDGKSIKVIAFRYHSRRLSPLVPALPGGVQRPDRRRL